MDSTLVSDNLLIPCYNVMIEKVQDIIGTPATPPSPSRGTKETTKIRTRDKHNRITKIYVKRFTPSKESKYQERAKRFSEYFTIEYNDETRTCLYKRHKKLSTKCKYTTVFIETITFDTSNNVKSIVTIFPFINVMNKLPVSKWHIKYDILQEKKHYRIYQVNEKKIKVQLK